MSTSLALQLLADSGGNALGQRRTGLIDRCRRSADRIADQLAIEWCTTSIAFDHYRFHRFSPH
jgi:hypothetical protein